MLEHKEHNKVRQREGAAVDGDDMFIHVDTEGQNLLLVSYYRGKMEMRRSWKTGVRGCILPNEPNPLSVSVGTTAMISSWTQTVVLCSAALSN